MNSRDRGQFRQDRGRNRFEQIHRRNNLGKIQETMADKIAEKNTETTIIGMIEVGIGLEKGCFQGAMTIIELGV